MPHLVADFAGLPVAAVYAVAFVFGALWGSFLNVCIVRLPARRSVVRPASHCLRCGGRIRWYDNVPIVSYALLRGRCRACGASISPRYLVVELLTGLLCLAIVHRFGLSWTSLATFILAAGLVVATFVDLTHYIIPNEVTYLLVPVGLGMSFVPGATVAPLDAFIGAAAGAGVLVVVAATYRLLRGVRGLGGGDVKLLAAIGAFLGWRPLPLVLFLAAAQGVVAAGIVLLARRGKPAPAPPPPPPEESDDEEQGPPPGRLAIPFGPFLALATLQAIFFGNAIYQGLFGVSL